MLYILKYFLQISFYGNIRLKLDMGRINIVVDDGLEMEFRREVGKRFGAKKGNIKAAIEEAMNMWIGQIDRKHLIST
jgi:hypothetical protein